MGGRGGRAAGRQWRRRGNTHGAKSSVAGIPTGQVRACNSATSRPATLQCRASTKVAHPAHVRKTAPRLLQDFVADYELQRPRRQALHHAAGALMARCFHPKPTALQGSCSSREVRMKACTPVTARAAPSSAQASPLVPAAAAPFHHGHDACPHALPKSAAHQIAEPSWP